MLLHDINDVIMELAKTAKYLGRKVGLREAGKQFRTMQLVRAHTNMSQPLSSPTGAGKCALCAICGCVGGPAHGGLPAAHFK